MSRSLTYHYRIKGATYDSRRIYPSTRINACLSRILEDLVVNTIYTPRALYVDNEKRLNVGGIRKHVGSVVGLHVFARKLREELNDA